MSEENPICTITVLDHPEEIPEDRAIQITIVYENFGITGPTFYRVRKPGTFDFTMMGDTENHVSGEPSGSHTYYAAPKGHLILQLEVGHGTWLNPIEITDSAMIIILDPACPAPDVDDTKIVVDIVHPPKFWPVVQRFYIEPGAVISTAWINDNRHGEHTWKMQLQRALDGPPVQMDWTVDNIPWTDRNTVFEIAPRERQVIELKATIPKSYDARELAFMVYPVNRKLVTS